MKIGIVKEIRPDEKRVAATPRSVARLVKSGWEVLMERGAGAEANYRDDDYQAAGAVLADHPEEVWSRADLVAKIRPPVLGEFGAGEADLLPEGGTLISFVYPAQHEELIQRMAKRRANLIALDCIPRISRAQKVDALSSMANIAGYRAVVEAAGRFGSFFTGQITAAGKVPPAQVLVIGAGVAGLAAIAAAKGLGAVVRAFDVRASVADQVRSLGAEFLTVEVKEAGEGQGGYAKAMSEEFHQAEMALFRKQASVSDIVITTALIPGRPAPKLWLKDMVGLMRPGSVIVDLGAENGGNCELTRPGEVIVHEGVTIIGYTDMPSRMANVASELLGNNLWHLLDEMGGPAGFKIDTGNEIVRGALILQNGTLMWPPPRKAAPEVAPVPGAQPAPTPPTAASGKGHGGAQAETPAKTAGLAMAALGILAACAWLYLRYQGGADTLVGPGTMAFLQHLTVFVMAVFVGWQVVWNVTPALHTPLMSVTNAISGIIVVGGLIGGRGDLDASATVAVIATLFATINIAGGFLVTRRMLAMFRK